MKTYLTILGLLVFVGLSAASPTSGQNRQENGQSVITILSAMPLFEGLTSGEIKQVAERCELKAYSSNTALIKKGQEIDRLYLMVSGSGNILFKDRVIPFGRHILLGEVEYVDPVPAVADVVLATNSKLIEIRYAAIDSLFRSEPDLGLKVMRNLARALSRKVQEKNE